jgi:glycosyltransferase involved in cell wall biosynthesis
MLDDRPLRVLFVTSALEPGGSEGQLTELVARAHPELVHATVATLYATRSRRHLDRLETSSVPVYALAEGDSRRWQRVASATRRLPSLLRAVRPDVVYAWLEEAATVTVPVARAMRIPVVVSRRNVCGSSMERYPPLRAAIRRVEASAQLVTANSEAVRDEAIHRGIASERLRIVLNGHDLLPALEPPPAPPVRLGYLAHLRPEKGHLRLLEVLARLPRHLDWHADLAGSGPLQTAVREQVATLGLGDRVSLLGAVSDVRGFWADRHVAVLLSDHEGSSNTLIEAAMAGRPLVATDVSGNRSIVTRGTGVLVPLDDPGAGAASLAELIADPGLRASMGAAAHEQAAERYSMDRFVAGHVAVLHSAAQGSRSWRATPRWTPLRRSH